MAEICRKYPTRFAGLASFAPQSPKRAAREMERAIRKLKLNGFILNSHTHGEYLDDPKYWPVLEAPRRSMPAFTSILAPRPTASRVPSRTTEWTPPCGATGWKWARTWYA